MQLMEIMTHTLYSNSVSKYKLWQRYRQQLQITALDMGMIGFWVLMFMWLKVSLLTMLSVQPAVSASLRMLAAYMPHVF